MKWTTGNSVQLWNKFNYKNLSLIRRTLLYLACNLDEYYSKWKIVLIHINIINYTTKC
jgi:hypothetical protein